MKSNLTINNLLPVLTIEKLSERNATIQNTTFVGTNYDIEFVGECKGFSHLFTLPIAG